MKNREILTYKFFNRRTEAEVEGIFEAYWEVSLDPISDDYIFEEITTLGLLDLWAKEVRTKHPNNLIPIFWFVEAKGAQVRTFEFMPFQYKHLQDTPKENFLTFFTHPINSITGEPLNWLTIPVVDKLWTPQRQDKGGFIQQATGWKPSSLQPYIYLPSLMEILVR